MGRAIAREPRIVRNPSVVHGKPVIAGTRIDVSTVLHQLANGLSFEEMEREYGVSGLEIRAVLRYAAEQLDTSRDQAD